MVTQGPKQFELGVGLYCAAAMCELCTCPGFAGLYLGPNQGKPSEFRLQSLIEIIYGPRLERWIVSVALPRGFP